MTAKAVLRRRQAQRDVEQAADHYFGEGGVALELRFLTALEAAIQHVAAYPASGSLRYGGALDLTQLRFWPVKHFAYLVFYTEREAAVDVWRVLHAHRDIPAWLTRSE
ncbi:MAG TPA: type II toxin-antitoxin system RelE/ParE family toxin [Rhodanobacteraceae bacterium]|nr:type II toxin-antitoxin system RelE/ParE family toxin [Rhodanobacteraceae bacterium]